jgi:hypothetical protein
MRCDDARTLLSTRRDLPLAQRAELDMHLGGCRACAAARRDEERTTRLLALLPDPHVAVPARVRAAVQTMATRSRRSHRLRGGAVLAASLGATALIAALLLNAVTGGRLLGTAGEAQTAARPLATAAPAPLAGSTEAEGELLYLVHQASEGQARLIAWEPGPDRTRFSVSLGTPPVYRITDGARSADRLLPPHDFTLSPDSSRLFVIEYQAIVAEPVTYDAGNGDRLLMMNYGDDGAALVAYDAQRGGELWRTPLVAYSPYITPQSGGSLSVSPDGSRLFVRSVAPPERPGGPRLTIALQAYDARTGASIGQVNRLLPNVTAVVPLNNQTMLVSQNDGAAARIDLGLAYPFNMVARLDEGVSLAAPVPMPGPSALYGLTPDLKILEVDLLGGGLDVAAEVDLVPRGAFFFDRAAFSHDGQTLAVGQTTRDPQTRLPSSEVRIYGAGPWRALFAPLRYDRPLVDLAVSADGERVSIVLGPAGSRASAAPIGAVPAERAALLTLHTGSGTITARPLDPAIVGIVAGR